MKHYLIIAAGACASLAQANLLVNGSFEDQQIGNDTFLTVNNGQSNITGWIVEQTSVDIVSGPSRFIAQDGNQSIDIAGTPGPGTIKQSFATVAGQLYTVSFWLSSNTETSGDRSVNYDFEGVTGNVTGGLVNGAWIQFSDSFVATTNLSTIAFSSGDNGFAGGLIDNVSVEAVPEPFTLAALGLIAAAASRRKRN
jgi:choice-of-anchor C domain-containing protein